MATIHSAVGHSYSLDDQTPVVKDNQSVVGGNQLSVVEPCDGWRGISLDRAVEIGDRIIEYTC